jgi:hypothetical protein
MLRDRRDYLLRMIEQAAAAAARLRQRLLGGDPVEEVVREARAAQIELLGKDAAMLAMLDGRSAAHVLGDRERLIQWAELLRVAAMLWPRHWSSAPEISRRRHDQRISSARIRESPRPHNTDDTITHDHNVVCEGLNHRHHLCWLVQRCRSLCCCSRADVIRVLKPSCVFVCSVFVICYLPCSQSVSFRDSRRHSLPARETG